MLSRRIRSRKGKIPPPEEGYYSKALDGNAPSRNKTQGKAAPCRDRAVLFRWDGVSRRVKEKLTEKVDVERETAKGRGSSFNGQGKNRGKSRGGGTATTEELAG